LQLATQLVASPLYRVWAQLGVVLLLLMGLDAGFSGDWSRIGVLTTEQEQQLQQVGGWGRADQQPIKMGGGQRRLVATAAGFCFRAVDLPWRGVQLGEQLFAIQSHAAALLHIFPCSACTLPLLQFAQAVGCFHLLCAAAAATVGSQRGERWAPRVAKVLAVGFLALVEVVLLPEGGGDGPQGA
jgi:hypothetical protein